MPTAQLVESRVDWLTCTAGTGAKSDALAELGIAVASERERVGAKRRSGNWQGYYGEWCGGMFVGRRHDGVVLRLGGAEASDYWRAAVQLSDHQSRIDLAVTVRPDGQDRDLATEAYDALRTAPRGRGKPRLAKLIVDNQRGRTLYLGRRTSDAYLRLYDKGVESHEQAYHGAWRYELEAKGTLAPQYSAALLASDSESSLLAGMVAQAFECRGVLPSWDAPVGGVVPRPLRPPTDDDRRLAWLASQVKPAVDRLIRDGRRDDALRALGLSGGDDVALN